MKATSVIILLLVSKAKTSFFDDFAGAMSSVENAFGKLLNDVVTDVKTTMHCTILAVEQVLAINGVISEPLSNKECYRDDNNDNSGIETKKDDRNDYSAHDFAQEISSSISKVNKSLGHILDNNGHQRLEDVKRILRNESNRLTEVSFLLRQELEKISQRMSKEYQNVALDSDKSSLESVWNNMKILYEVEKNDKNSSEEIGQVLNEALDVLHIDKISEVKSDGDKIKAIMQELQQETIGNNASNDTINRELLQWEGEQSVLQNNLEHKLPDAITETVKDVTTKVLGYNDKTEKEVNDYISDESSSFTSSELPSKSIQVSNNETSESSNTYLDDYSPFVETDSKNAIDQAMDILKTTADTQTTLDNFFANEHGADVFDNSDLFDFEK